MKTYQANDGTPLAYAEHGTGGLTLVLVHGFPLSHAMWQSQWEGLADVCRVVAPDLRGYGDSPLGDWPADGETPSLARYADDLATLIDALDSRGPVVLAGFSMGGYIAFEMLRRNARCFDAFALLDTKATADDEAGVETRLKMADKINEWGTARVAELMRPKLFAPGTPDAIVEETVAVISATHPAAIAASQRAMASRPDSTDLLAAIDKPALVLVGAEDSLTPPAGMRSMADALPSSRYVEIAGAGHMAPVEKPAAVNAALREFVLSL